MIGSAEEFVRLRNSSEPAEYHRAAAEEAPEAVWLDVMNRYPDQRMWVAQNKTVPLSVLTILARDPDPRVRRMVAMKRKLSPELLEVLAADTDEAVRMSVVRHRNTAWFTLETLRHDEWDAVRAAVEKRLEH